MCVCIYAIVKRGHNAWIRRKNLTWRQHDVDLKCLKYRKVKKKFFHLFYQQLSSHSILSNVRSSFSFIHNSKKSHFGNSWLFAFSLVCSSSSHNREACYLQTRAIRRVFFTLPTKLHFLLSLSELAFSFYSNVDVKTHPQDSWQITWTMKNDHSLMQSRGGEGKNSFRLI